MDITTSSINQPHQGDQQGHEGTMSGNDQLWRGPRLEDTVP